MAATLLPAAAFRPSASVKWMFCPGAPTLEAGLPDVESEYAASGSRQHRFAELSLLVHRDGQRLVASDEWRNGLRAEYGELRHSLPQDQQDSVNGYVEWVLARRQPVDILLIEEQVWHGQAIGVPGAKGKLDLAIIRTDGRSITIIDRKFPWGKPVYASGSADAEGDGEPEDFGTMRGHPPLMLYALGLVETFGGWLIDVNRLERIEFAIYQESAGRVGNESVWSCTPQYLESFRSMAANAVRRVNEALAAAFAAEFDAALTNGQSRSDWYDNYLRPGKTQCKYCKAKPTCPKLRDQSLTAVAGTEVALSGELQPQLEGWELRLAGLTDEKLEEVYEQLPLVKEWADAVRWQMYNRMTVHHAKMARHKIVPGRQGNRKWADERAVADTAEGLLLDCLFEKKLVGPAQAEKLAKKNAIPGHVWEALQQQIERAPGKPTIAESHDNREEIDVTPKEVPCDLLPPIETE